MSTKHSKTTPTTTRHSKTTPTATRYSKTTPTATRYSKTTPTTTRYSKTTPTTTRHSINKKAEEIKKDEVELGGGVEGGEEEQGRPLKYVFENVYAQFLRNMSVRGEFKLSMLTFSFVPAEIFLRSQWISNRRCIVVYRSCTMLYTLTTLITSIRGFHYSSTAQQGWGVWLCNWNYLLLTLHFMLSYVFVLANYMHEKKILPLSTSTYTLTSVSPDLLLLSDFKYEVTPWYYKVDWLCFSISLQISSLLTCLYFFSVFPRLQVDFLPVGDAQMYLVSTLLTSIDFSLTCFPIRLAHLVYAWHFLSLHTIFCVVLWLASDHKQPLCADLIDWNNSLATLLRLFVVFAFVQPLIQTFFYALHRLKSFVYLKWVVKEIDFGAIEGEGVEVGAI